MIKKNFLSDSFPSMKIINLLKIIQMSKWRQGWNADWIADAVRQRRCRLCQRDTHCFVCNQTGSRQASRRGMQWKHRGDCQHRGQLPSE